MFVCLSPQPLSVLPYLRSPLPQTHSSHTLHPSLYDTHISIHTKGDTRETASVFVCRNLLEERARLFVFDPKVRLSIRHRNDGWCVVVPKLSVRGLHCPTVVTTDASPSVGEAIGCCACTDGRKKSIT